MRKRVNNIKHYFKYLFQIKLLKSLSIKFSIFNYFLKNYKKRLLGNKIQYIVIEYPKCGRSWLRFMIHQAEALKYDVPLKNTIYEIYYSQFSLPRVNYIHGFKPKIPLQVYHHDMPDNSIRRKGYIFLVRDPIRVIISYYHQMRYRENLFKGSIKEFIHDPNYGIEKYIEYIDYYFEKIISLNHIIIRYEDLKQNTFKFFKNILNFVELNLPDYLIENIINNSSFDKMQEIEQKRAYNVYWLKPSNNNDIRGSKVRSKGKENISDFFDQEDIDYLNNQCFEKTKSFIKLGYHKYKLGN